MTFLRAVLFNILFYGLTAAACVLLLPFILMPRKAVLWIIRVYTGAVYGLEKYVLGLDYEVRGRENLPRSGAYLVAAKHQSAYETMKLHRLFADPSVILKQELLRIPLWGRFVERLDVIAIDRKNGEEAMTSIIEGAQRMVTQGRPVIIFPQGTRVHVGTSSADKPYKAGIVKMRAATNLPVIPMALNSGLFWPRNGFIKRPGKVVFEFLPPVPEALDDKAALADIESRVESASALLMAESRKP